MAREPPSITGQGLIGALTSKSDRGGQANALPTPS